MAQHPKPLFDRETPGPRQDRVYYIRTHSGAAGPDRWLGPFHTEAGMKAALRTWKKRMAYDRAWEERRKELGLAPPHRLTDPDLLEEPQPFYAPIELRPLKGWQ